VDAGFASLGQQFGQARYTTVPDPRYVSKVTPWLRRTQFHVHIYLGGFDAAGRRAWSSSAAGSMECCGRGCKGWTAARSRQLYGVDGQLVPGSITTSSRGDGCSSRRAAGAR